MRQLSMSASCYTTTRARGSALVHTPSPGAHRVARSHLIKIVVGEDSYLAREGITRALETAGDVEILASCPDLESLRAAIEEHLPEVVLTDIRMPPSNTDEGIRLAE